ncbi:MAG: hypothetical protein CSB24_02980 [Deltaproteobacteria bacterium]|nr:MAG: hypothetical protein CSB24_02980 [Deltaproteobacteria bacterium]
MTASRKKIEGKPALKLNIHNFTEADLPFLDSLGITETEGENIRFAMVHSQQEFLDTRGAILERYHAEEKGPRVFLTPKDT